MSGRTSTTRPRPAAAHHPDDTRFAQPRADLQPGRAQPLRDDPGGTMFLKSDLRVHVQVASRLDHFGMPRL